VLDIDNSGRTKLSVASTHIHLKERKKNKNNKLLRKITYAKDQNQESFTACKTDFY
jgi:predicted RNA-binding protein with RPS1 domain